MATLEDIIVIMLIALVGMAFVSLVCVVLGLDEDIADYWNRIKSSLKRKTDLEKEIAATQKDVDFLEKQKEQLKELEELERRKQRLIKWAESEEDDD